MNFRQKKVVFPRDLNKFTRAAWCIVLGIWTNARRDQRELVGVLRLELCSSWAWGWHFCERVSHCHHPRSNILCSCSWSRGGRCRHGEWFCPTKQPTMKVTISDIQLAFPLLPDSIHCFLSCIQRWDTGIIASRSNWTIHSGPSADRRWWSPDHLIPCCFHSWARS